MEEKISKSISILSTFQSVVTMTIPGLYIQFGFCFYFLMILFFLLVQKSYVNTIHFPVFPVLYSRSDWTRWNANINGIFCVWKQEKSWCFDMASNTNDNETEPILLVNKLTPHFLCPVCGQLYRNPVINIKCGHTFCKNCASGCSQCPVDNEPCDASQLIVNRCSSKYFTPPPKKISVCIGYLVYISVLL